MLGASFDPVEANAKFAARFSFPFLLLCDVSREIGLAYGACDSADAGTPKRISYVIGPDGAVRAAYPKVSPPTHPQEVLDFLSAG